MIPILEVEIDSQVGQGDSGAGLADLTGEPGSCVVKRSASITALERNAEKHGVAINWHPKPVKGDWNGSGMHANFSDGTMRSCGDKAVFTKICEVFSENIQKHIAVYGADNDQRLTGLHETESIDTFSYGEFDRGASIRIPVGTIEDGWKGRLEDRRPASNGDPYKIAAVIITTTKFAY